MTCVVSELYRAYASQGADVLLVPSAFTYTTGQGALSAVARPRD
jgi:nitrilase